MRYAAVGGKTTAAILGLAMLVALLGTFVLAPLSAGAATQTTNRVTDIPIAGTLPGGGAFHGTFDLKRFLVRDGQLLAAGTITGRLTNALGQTIGRVNDVPVRLPVADVSGSCQILHLDLGPLDLNLLGLKVHLNEVVLD